MNTNFFTFDDEMDSVIDSLEMATEILKKTKSDPSKSKWLSFALYHALYITLISALNRSNPDTVIEERTGWVFSFSKALRLAQDSRWMKQYTFSEPLKLTPEQKKNLDELQDYRDFHWHKTPKGIIEAPLRPEVIKDTIDVIDFLVFQSGNIQLYETERERKMKHALEQIRESTGE